MGAISTLIEREHVFVTAQGSVYSQFKRALKRRNFMLAWTMASELPKMQLGDALAHAHLKSCRRRTFD